MSSFKLFKENSIDKSYLNCQPQIISEFKQNLANCDLKGINLSTKLICKNVQVLNLCKNKIRYVPLEIERLSCLYDLDISNNPIIKISASGILNLKLLNTLRFDWCQYCQKLSKTVDNESSEFSITQFLKVLDQ